MNSQELQRFIGSWKEKLNIEKNEFAIKTGGFIEVCQENLEDVYEQHKNTGENDKENHICEHLKTIANRSSGNGTNEENHVRNKAVNDGGNGNKNFLITPLTSQNNNNSSHNNNDKSLTGLKQKQGKDISLISKKTLKKTVLPVNLREIEKERYAKVCENSHSHFGDVMTENNKSSKSNSNTEIIKTVVKPKQFNDISLISKNTLKKTVLPTDLREIEKERFAKVRENSHSHFGDGTTGNNKSSIRVFHEKNNQSNKKLKSDFVPIRFERDREINRLAELFENSPTSRDRVYKEDASHTQLSAYGINALDKLDQHYHPTDLSEPELYLNGKPFTDEWENNEITGYRNDQTSETSLTHNVLVSPVNCLNAPTSEVSSTNLLYSGIGEYNDKRKKLIEQRKKDYCDYMQQARLQMRNTHPVAQSCYSNHVQSRDVSVQTDFSSLNIPNSVGDNTAQRPSYFMDNNERIYSSNHLNRDNRTSKGTCTSIPVSPTRSDRSGSRSPRGKGDLHKSVNYLPGSPYLSPTTPNEERANTESCIDVGASSTHMKQYIYREELKKQIEERQRLEAERKEREKREEEAMERRVREQQEKLRKQYEMEEAQRLEYAMRRHLQDDVLRQRLTEADLRAIQNNYTNYTKKQRPTLLPCPNIAPFISPDDRPLPLPEKKDKLQQKSNTNTSMMASTMNNTTNTATTANDTDKTAEQGAIVINKQPSKPINLNRSNSQNNSNNNSNNINSDNEIDPLIGVDLLADGNPDNCNFRNDINTFSEEIIKENDNSDFIDELNNMGGRLEDMTMNDRNHFNSGSTSPIIPAVRTKSRLASNLQILNDKWQVPAVEKTYIRPTALHNHRLQPPQMLTQNSVNNTLGVGIRNNYDNNYMNNVCNLQSVRSDNVLTQLGSFRRQLQLEHLKLQEQFYNQQVGVSKTNLQNNKPPVTSRP